MVIKINSNFHIFVYIIIYQSLIHLSKEKMGVDDVLEIYVEDIKELLDKISKILKRKEIKEGELYIQDIQLLFSKKFNEKFICRSENRAQEFIAQRNELKLQFESLKEDILSESVDVDTDEVSEEEVTTFEWM